jgi:hypothetical protein
MMRSRFAFAVVAASCLVAVATVTCAKKDSSPTCAAGGGPVSGPADTHCTAWRATSQAACSGVVGGGGAGGSGVGGVGPEFGATHYGTSAYDDDCKYHVSWSVDGVCQSAGVLFHIVVTRTVDNQPALGADPRAEVFLDSAHSAPSVGAATEIGGGAYDVGPVRFDEPGQWTVRFHLYGICDDSLPDSPHGHAAFYVDVP